MKPTATALCCVTLALFSFVLSCSSSDNNSNSSCTQDYWVATNGSDSATGASSDPFLTISHARDVIRANRNKGVCSINVNIKGGLYRLSGPLVFTSQDSGSSSAQITYKAAPGETPVISGAVQISGWTLHDAVLGIWQAQTNVNTSTMPRQLYVNGVRAIRARTVYYPNYYTPTATGYTYSYVSGADPQIPPVWDNPTFVEAVTATQWKMMRCPVAEINGGSEVVMQNPCWTNANVFPEPWNFHLLSWWENAYEFLDQRGEWYLNPVTKILYYIPLEGQDMSTADVELPVLESLLSVSGDATNPVSHINFKGLSFEYATWLSPNTSNGYVADQSGFHLTGAGHASNTIGHDPNTVRTPGNLSFLYAQNITFENNTVEHMGGAGVDFATGSQNNRIINNVISDISSTGIQLGGNSFEDARPSTASGLTKDNLISNNLIEYTGQEFWDAAGIYIGITTRSIVEYNDINHTAWSGIAIGWGWALLDPGGFVGVPGGWPNMWGTFTTPTAATGNRIVHNHIQYFLERLWDGGAIYTTGFQGTTESDGQLIAFNVAENKRTLAGGNTFYTDGGSRYVTVRENVSLNNPQGVVDLGPCGKSSSFPLLCDLTGWFPYGEDMGGCTPYGDLYFEQNYFRNSLDFFALDYNGLCETCYYPNHPVGMYFINNVKILSSSDVPASILSQAGRQNTSNAGFDSAMPSHHYQIQSEGFGCPSESMITNRNLQIFTRDFFYGIRYLELPELRTPAESGKVADLK
jgi:hypothetical protein